jgi:hypothetical protein
MGAALPVALRLLAGAWITIGIPTGIVKRLYGVFLMLLRFGFCWWANYTGSFAGFTGKVCHRHL